MKTKLIITAVACLVAGAALGAGLTWRTYSRLIAAKEVEFAMQAAMDANTLAQLRLNQTAAAIEFLETRMFAATAALATWDEVHPPGDKEREQRDRCLVGVKVYATIYPAKGEMAAQVNAFLARIPDRDPRSVCKSAICRLDDLNRAGEHPTTHQ